jgi:hypothetical protein
MRTFSYTPFLLVLLLAAFAAPLGAQEEDDIEEEPAAPQALRQNVFQFAPEQIDQWIFGGNTNAAGRRQQLETHLKLRVAELVKVCSLTDVQQKKLMLAGRGDIKRTMDRVDALKRKFKAAQMDNNAWNQMWQEIAPFQNIPLSAVFDESSLFHKTIAGLLDSGQAAKYEQVVQERRGYRHRARLALLVSMYEQQMPLDDEQRQRFLKLLVEEVQPPPKRTANEYYGFMIQVARIPEEKLKPIFDEAQWKLFSPQLAEMKRMEPFFQNGVFVNQVNGQVVEKAEEEEE